jgi:hypothetical protein
MPSFNIRVLRVWLCIYVYCLVLYLLYFTCTGAPLSFPQGLSSNDKLPQLFLTRKVSVLQSWRTTFPGKVFLVGNLVQTCDNVLSFHAVSQDFRWNVCWESLWGSLTWQAAFLLLVEIQTLRLWPLGRVINSSVICCVLGVQVSVQIWEI